MSSNANSSKTPSPGRPIRRIHNVPTHGTPATAPRTSPAVTMKLQAQSKALQDKQQQLESIGADRDQLMDENAQLKEDLKRALADKKK